MGVFRVIEYDPYAFEFEAWIKRTEPHRLIDVYVAYTEVLLGNVDTMLEMDKRSSLGGCTFGMYPAEDREAIAKIRLKVLGRELGNQGMWPWAVK